MDSRLPDAIAEEWLLKWSTGEPNFEVKSTLDWELPKKQPDLCLAAIVEVLERLDPSTPNQALGALAAGPLEDLLAYNGDAVIRQVELLARRDPAFRMLLNGVWDSRISPSVLASLSKYRKDRW